MRLFALSSQQSPQGTVMQLISAAAAGSQLSPPSCRSSINVNQSSPAVFILRCPKVMSACVCLLAATQILPLSLINPSGLSLVLVVSTKTMGASAP